MIETMNPTATEIVSADLTETGDALRIAWGDGHESVYDLRYLRRQCPCAACRHVQEQLRANPLTVLPPRLANPSAELTGAEPVGRYGLRFVWGDGHDTGIYTFEYLREICPCPACQSQPAAPR